MHNKADINRKRKGTLIMNCRKYRICLMILIIAVLAGSTIYYMWNENREKEPADGMLVQNVEEVQKQESRENV